MKITNKLIKSLNPCEDRFSNYIRFYKDKSHTKAQFMGLKNITHSDKMWVAMKLLPTHLVDRCAADIAEVILSLFESTYPYQFTPRLVVEAVPMSSENLADLYTEVVAGFHHVSSCNDSIAYAAAYAAIVYAASSLSIDNNPKIQKQIRKIALKYWSNK